MSDERNCERKTPGPPRLSLFLFDQMKLIELRSLGGFTVNLAPDTPRWTFPSVMCWSIAVCSVYQASSGGYCDASCYGLWEAQLLSFTYGLIYAGHTSVERLIVPIHLPFTDASLVIVIIIFFEGFNLLRGA